MFRLDLRKIFSPQGQSVTGTGALKLWQFPFKPAKAVKSGTVFLAVRALIGT